MNRIRQIKIFHLTNSIILHYWIFMTRLKKKIVLLTEINLSNSKQLTIFITNLKKRIYNKYA